MPTWFTPLMQWLALPEVGLSTVFVVAFVSATLLPMGSEPAVFGLVKLNPDLFWPAVLVATAGNTLGGVKLSLRALHRHLAAEKAANGGRDPPLINGFTPEQRLFLAWSQAWRENGETLLLIYFSF